LIVQLSDRAANLTRQLLAFARKPALTRHPASVVRLLTATADFVRRSLSIDVQLDMDAPPEAGMTWMALADTNQLQQVLVNLCVNARDAMTQRPPAPILIRLRHKVLPAGLAAFPQNVPAGDYLVIEVEDRGCGMSADVLGQALDPFFTTKDVGQGTGLGLPVAFGIMTGHQGFLTIDSRVDSGTCIRLHLPRLIDESAPAAMLDAAPVLEPESTPSRHILVVDDEEAVTDVIRRFLAIAGHEVTCMTSAAQALEFLARPARVDMVILDLMIPHEDGATNYRRLREHCPDLPILLCTGLVQSNTLAALQEQGAVSLLRKPFRMNELWYAVNRCLEQQ
jgi:two-component system cell cycle sensor histidine kinase/response regulator CckA